jgi:integrase
MGLIGTKAAGVGPDWMPISGRGVGPNWMPITRSLLPKRFERIKEVAGALKIGKIRDGITIYSFRDLWISEILMAGNDVSTVARMAGTSISMIERVYGHFRNEHLREAQSKLDEARKKRRG